MLVAAGASLDITDHRGLTPRLLALQSDDQDLAAYLESKEFSVYFIIFSLMFVLLYCRSRTLPSDGF